ncbi:hypothetical protein H257_13216 [Aphanomyces astaci]|uniref:Uncharacterized protein n=1 Tax=Aphanomyces astaci TaxID=112090 RepID=W4FVQ6_APHAT|nr:hypothetical protein H257_13216 [Aphanomyces astaci]ETV71552.1 hypothetical protein H257_13216 [Aphanomyces astaci]|eukprot:XP_009838985.1 hypothetical protein H257_13216 [Aphanomyces astaci]
MDELFAPPKKSGHVRKSKSPCDGVDPPPVEVISDGTDVTSADPALTDMSLDLVSVADDEILLSCSSDEECKIQGLEKRTKATEGTDEAVERSLNTAHCNLTGVLDRDSDLPIEPRSSSEDLVYTDNAIEASFDESMSDVSMLTENYDEEMSIVPFTAASSAPHFDSGGRVHLVQPKIWLGLCQSLQLECTTHTVQLDTNRQLTVVCRASVESYETSLALDQTRSRFDSPTMTRLTLPASSFAHESAVYNPALPLGLSPVVCMEPAIDETFPRLMNVQTSSNRRNEPMGVEASSNKVPSQSSGMVRLHQLIVERQQHLMNDETMGIDLPDKIDDASHAYRRVSNEFQHLSSDVQALSCLLLEQLPVTSAVPDDTRPRLEALRQEIQLLHDCGSSLVHDMSLLQDHVLLLEARIDRLSLDFSSRLAQAETPAPESSSRPASTGLD